MTSTKSGSRGWYRVFGKRMTDLVIACPALVIALPVMGVIGLAVRAKLGAPVLFTQVRPGRDGRLFPLRKFRSMTDARNPDGTLRSDSDRLTSFGRALRSTSLDELPEFWNIVKGDMSLVGPRPLLTEYLPLYSAEQARRHDVRPGLTGWAQVNGRNAITWEEKFALDTWYVDNMSFALDSRIIWRTLTAVFSRRGVSSAGGDTAAPFTGTPDC